MVNRHWDLMPAEVDGHKHINLVCFEKNQLIGAARIVHPDTDTPTLGDLFVLPEFRRQGVATLLMGGALHWADQAQKSLYLHVRLDNESAVDLYCGLRFEFTGEFNEAGSAWMIKSAWEGRLEEPVSREEMLVRAKLPENQGVPQLSIALMKYQVPLYHQFMALPAQEPFAILSEKAYDDEITLLTVKVKPEDQYTLGYQWASFLKGGGYNA